MSISLKERLLIYITRIGQPIASGELQRIVAKGTKYSPSNVTRRLRELEVEDKILVSYKKGHAWYRSKQSASDAWFESL